MENRPSNPEAPEPPAHGPLAGDPGLLTWTDLVQSVRRSLWIILSASSGLAVLVFLVLVLCRSPMYKAVATLEVVAQPLDFELSPSAPAVDEYRSLLESTLVVAATANRLRGESVLEERQPLRIGHEIDSAVVVSPRAQGTALSHIIEAVAESSAPEIAATVANTWSEVFVEQARQIHEDTLAQRLTLIERRYEEGRKQLLDLIEEEARVADEYQARFEELSQAWDRRVVEAKQATWKVILEQRGESRLVIEEFAVKSGLPLVVENSGGATKGGRLVDPSSAVEGKLFQILSLRTRLAQTPRFLLVGKVFSDETLPQAKELEQGESTDPLPSVDRQLIEPEVNPVYQQLTLQLARIEADLDSFSSDELRRVQRFASELERLQDVRSTKLAEAILDRALVTADLERQRSRRIQSLQQEGRLKLDQIRADIASQREIVTRLTKYHSEAGSAGAERGIQRVRLTAPASPPATPRPRHIPLLTLVAAVVGALLGFVVSLLRESMPGESRPPMG